jgi:hypothetical protein
MTKVKYYTTVAIASMVILSVVYGFSKNENSNRFQTLRPAADTTGFAANAAEGWSALSVYFNNKPDSTEFEVILFRDTLSGINWYLPANAGTIDIAYIPAAETSWQYEEPLRTWNITIGTDGKCFFRLISGDVPPGNPAVIPVKTIYKR